MSHYKPYPAYRPSGVEWIGDVPKHWDVHRFKTTIASCRNGIWGEDAAGDENDIPCVRVADFDRINLRVKLNDPTIRNVTMKERSSRLISRGNLLLEKSGGGENQPVGCVVQYEDDRPAVCSNFVARMEIAQGFDSSFLRYLHASAYSVRLSAGSINQTSGIQNLDQERYFNEKAGFPSLNEQRSIATSIESETKRIDSLITKKTRFIELLKEKRQALITHAVTKGLNPNVKMRDSGVEWIGEVPEHWQIAILKRFVVFQRGHDLPSDARVEGIVPVVSSAGYSGTHNVSKAKSPGIVTGRYGSLGEFTFVQQDYWPLNTALYSIDLYENEPRFIWYLLKNISDLFLLYSAKAAVPGIDRNDIHEIYVAAPLPEEQKRISNYLDIQFDRINTITVKTQQSIDLLKERRSAFITAAVTGQIDLREAP